MKPSLILFLSSLCVVSLTPSASHGGYLFPGSNALQPLAVVEPATRDDLFQLWKGTVSGGGRWELGAFYNIYRNSDNSRDWDTIVTLTGAVRPGTNLAAGVTVPYIIRDPEFNDSDLLDLRGFVRYAPSGEGAGVRLGGELSFILPTGSAGDVYPFTLDSPVAGLRLALSGGSGSTDLGLNVGYQNYRETESGEDDDLLYGAYIEDHLPGPWSWALEVAGSTHRHSGPPGDGTVTDQGALLGVRYDPSERVRTGLAAGVGLGDGYSDLKIMACVSITFGGVRESGEGVKPAREAAGPPPGRDGVLVRIADMSGNARRGRVVAGALRREGYSVVVQGEPPPGLPERTALYYMPGYAEPAVRLSRVLILGRILDGVEVHESRVELGEGEILLVLGDW